jgi:glycerol uptake facilitator-like aquaporin
MFDIAKLSVETIGTFVLLFVILQTLSDKSIGPHAVAITLS